MSIKNFLSYIFKDNDPTTTDLFDSNWGNGVTGLLNNMVRAPHISVPSNDRQAQLSIEGSNYYIGHNGKDLGYPENYLTLVNMKRDDNLVIQLVYSHLGIWTRTVNNTTSLLDWQLVSTSYREELVTLANGWENYSGAGVGNYKRLSAVQIGGGQVRLQGLVKTGTNSHFATLPVHLRPANRQILTAWNGNHQPVRLNVDPDGRLVFQGTHTPTYMTLDGLIYTLL